MHSTAAPVPSASATSNPANQATPYETFRFAVEIHLDGIGLIVPLPKIDRSTSGAQALSLNLLATTLATKKRIQDEYAAVPAFVRSQVPGSLQWLAWTPGNPNPSVDGDVLSSPSCILSGLTTIRCDLLHQAEQSADQPQWVAHSTILRPTTISVHGGGEAFHVTDERVHELAVLNMTLSASPVHIFCSAILLQEIAYCAASAFSEWNQAISMRSSYQPPQIRVGSSARDDLVGTFLPVETRRSCSVCGELPVSFQPGVSKPTARVAIKLSVLLSEVKLTLCDVSLAGGVVSRAGSVQEVRCLLSRLELSSAIHFEFLDANFLAMYARGAESDIQTACVDHSFAPLLLNWMKWESHRRVHVVAASYRASLAGMSSHVMVSQRCDRECAAIREVDLSLLEWDARSDKVSEGTCLT